MEGTKFTIKGELTDLNVYIKALNSHRFTGSKIKKNETKRVYYEINSQHVVRVAKYPIKVTFRWYSKDNRMDIDNVAFAKKFILDGMVLAKVIENDSRKYVKAFADEFEIDRVNPRVEILIKEL